MINTINDQAEGLAPAAAAPTDLARLWEKWDSNMPGTKTPVVVDSVNALLDDYSLAEIEEAITIACKRNRRSLGYIEGILQKGAFSTSPSATHRNHSTSHSTNNGTNAILDYAKSKEMFSGRNNQE